MFLIKNDTEMKNQKNDLAKTETAKPNIDPKKGIDDWNNRLDQNLETEAHNDVLADEKAKDFSEKFGGDDQSD